MSGRQRLAGRRQLPQDDDPDPDRVLGLRVEAVVPSGQSKPGRNPESPATSAGRRQTQADHAVPGGVAASTTDERPRRHLVFLLKGL